MKFSNKKFYIPLLIIALIILVGVGLVFVSKRLPEEKKPAKEEQTPKELMLEIVNNPQQNKTSCSKIKDGRFRNQCLYAFTLKEAVENEDISLCESLVEEKIQDCKNNYYFRMASESGNLEPCSKIKQDNLRKSCQENAKRQKEYLASLPESTPGKTALCKKFENQTYKQTCEEILGLSSETTPKECYPESSQCEDLKGDLSQAICFSIAKIGEEKKEFFSAQDLSGAEEVSMRVCEGIESKDLQSQCKDFYHKFWSFVPEDLISS